ncbi:hypothetical protein HOY80DRAFT_1001018 [Tuber brumale]|nr:hypothetical protein HOY80DRAFT_1001018 [Tuber brumale]
MGAPTPGSIPRSDNEFSLMELFAALVLNTSPKSGWPPSLSEGETDGLIKFIKKDWTAQRIALCDIWCEAGLSYMSDSTVYCTLRKDWIRTYEELFKFSLNNEEKKEN